MSFAVRYIISFACALAAYWLSVWLGNATSLMSDRTFFGLQSPFFPPLIGLAIFAIVYGFVSGRVLKRRFWLAGAGVVGVTHVLGLAAIYQGVATVVESFVLIAILTFVLGWTLVRRAADPVAQ